MIIRSERKILMLTDETRHSPWSTPSQTVIQVASPNLPSRLVIFNSHARERQELVSFRVSEPYIKVRQNVLYIEIVIRPSIYTKVYMKKQSDGEDVEEYIPWQISPVIQASGDISNTEFELTFLTLVPALGLQTYYVRSLRPEEGPFHTMSVASIKIGNPGKEPFQASEHTIEFIKKDKK